MSSVRSGLSPRLSIPIRPVPSSTVGGRAELTVEPSQPSSACPAPGPGQALPCCPPRAALRRLQQREVPVPTGAAPPGTSRSHSGERAAPALPARARLAQPVRPDRPAEAAALSPCLPPCRDSGPARSQRSQPRCLATPLTSPRHGAGQRRGGILKPGHGGGKAGQEPRRCVGPAWCSRNLSIRMGKRKVPSNHPGNRGKTQHDWPDRLGNSRKETAWPLCHGLEPPLWGEAPGRAQGCSPATCSHESSLAAGCWHQMSQWCSLEHC